MLGQTPSIFSVPEKSKNLNIVTNDLNSRSLTQNAIIDKSSKTKWLDVAYVLRVPLEKGSLVDVGVEHLRELGFTPVFVKTSTARLIVKEIPFGKDKGEVNQE